ncbi:glycosyltransferase family 4 protein [candidate division KSB1 bacterium]|nr:glycosyltransferase family 4 protein [candidate division KSB1 bacterium]
MSVKKIKILRIQSRICIGGPAIHTEILSLHMPRDKYETLVVGGAVEKYEKSSHEKLIENDVRVEIIHSMKRNILLLNDIISIYQIYKIIKKYDPDIVETHTAKAGAVGRIAAVFGRVPIIIHTFHGHVFNNYFNRFITQLFVIIEKMLARVTDKIIVLSESQYVDIVKKYRIAPENKVQVVHLGLDLELYKNCQPSNELKKELGLNSDDVIIASIGRLVPIKNNKMLIDVVTVLRDRNKKYHLCFMGDGDLRSELEMISDRSCTHFLGWRTDLQNIYSGVDLVALTSLNEGTPIAIIEAMAAGVPVVCTNVGGVSDIVTDEETGFLVDSNDVSTMCAKINLLMEDIQLKNKMTTKARKDVLAKFSYQRLIKDMELLYDELLQ